MRWDAYMSDTISDYLRLLNRMEAVGESVQTLAEEYRTAGERLQFWKTTMDGVSLPSSERLMDAISQYRQLRRDARAMYQSISPEFQRHLKEPG